MALQLQWTKCTGDHWCNLRTLNLSHAHLNNLEGVYMIWHGAPNPAVVYVGQGIIRDRLEEHRQNPEILKYETNILFATWAYVRVQHRDGIERYLADQWSPKVGENHPNAVPIVVNSPWENDQRSGKI